jgi:glycosyltransferase involved in cell wall biosynthesis
MVTKLCFISGLSYSYFYSDIKTHIGGAEKQMALFAKEFAKDKDFDVNFCLEDFSQKDEEVICGVKLFKIFKKSDFVFKKYLILLKVLSKINADVYITRSVAKSQLLVLLFVKLFLRKKFVYMVASDKEVNIDNQLKILSFDYFFMYFVYKFSDLITTQKKHQFDEIINNKNLKENNVIVINNIIDPIDLSDFKKNGYVLFVGRADVIKNIELFISLVNKYKNVRFMMVCPKDKANPKYFYEIKKKAEVLDNLKFVDFVDPEDIGEVYKNARFYVLTSHYEGFSNTMMEAMNYGCPVLSYKVNPDGIIDDVGICCDGDLNKFYNSFERLLKDDDLAVELRNKSKKYIENNHYPEVVVFKFKNVLL